MKMKETLSIEDKIALFSNQNVVGLFETLLNPNDAFYDFAYPLCLGYYTVRSANKTISPVYEQAFETYVEIIKYENGDVDNLTEDELIRLSIQQTNNYMGSTIIRPKFIDKWTRIYNTLISEQYDALKEYEHTESKNGNNSDTTTYNTQVGKTGENTDTVTYNSQNGRTSNNSDTITYNTQLGKTGNNSDAITYNTNVEDNGNTSSKEVTTSNREKNADVFGFNSSSPVGDNIESENSTETVVGSADDNTTHNIQQKTGTETKNITLNETDNKTGTEKTDYVVDETVEKTGTDTKNLTINETENKTGTDTKRFVISEDVTKSGRNTTGAELIEAELNLRNTQIFFDIVYKDIDSVATIPLYI